MNRVRAFINGLFAKKKLSGTSALTKTLLDMAKVVTELGDTLDEADIEAQTASDRVRAAKDELKRIEDLMTRGDAVLMGLKSLFGITD
jgi:hypothetical protein